MGGDIPIVRGQQCNRLDRRGAGVGRTGLTRNQECPLGTQGSNPCLSANHFPKLSILSKLI